MGIFQSKSEKEEGEAVYPEITLFRCSLEEANVNMQILFSKHQPRFLARAQDDGSCQVVVRLPSRNAELEMRRDMSSGLLTGYCHKKSIQALLQHSTLPVLQVEDFDLSGSCILVDMLVIALEISTLDSIVSRMKWTRVLSENHDDMIGYESIWRILIGEDYYIVGKFYDQTCAIVLKQANENFESTFDKHSKAIKARDTFFLFG